MNDLMGDKMMATIKHVCYRCEKATENHGLCDDCSFLDSYIDEHFPKKDTLMAIGDEVCRARMEFPQTDGLMTALTEEVGELAKALLDEPWENVIAEAKQVAAMAIRMMEECDPSLHLVRIKRGQDDCCLTLVALRETTGRLTG
jgi:hypothetical protein